ncbi:TPA: glycosyltransferase family 2 protein [Serratia fonticola]
MKNAMFTVVIPNYKRIKELIRAIESVLNQSGAEELLESIIIVDDKSENIDKIVEALSLIETDKIILVRNEFKSNAAATRNQGARLAKSEWVCFLDSDDTFLPDKLTNLSIAVRSGADVYYNKAFVYFDDTLESIVPGRPMRIDEHISDYLFLSKQLMQTSMLTVRQSFFNRFGFNEKYIRHQDYDLCLSFEERKLKIEAVETVGTAIFWNSAERPNSKGESFNYSLDWLVENKDRMTKEAGDAFYFYFVVMKSARNGNKIYSLKRLFRASKKVLSVKQLIIYLCILLVPRFLQNIFYMNFKRLKCHVNKYKNIKK